MQTRVLAVGSESVFPKLVEVLMDNRYIVRSVDAKIGFVAFYQQWTDPDQGGAVIAMEGCAIFEALGPSSTRVRAMLTGGSHLVGVVAQGQQSADPVEYKRLLDLIDAGLSAPKTP